MSTTRLIKARFSDSIQNGNGKGTKNKRHYLVNFFIEADMVVY